MSSIFNSGKKSDYSKRSRSMAKLLSLGAGSLAIVFSFFIFFYFQSSIIVKGISLFLPLLYLVSYFLCFSKIENKKLYQIIFYIFIITSISLLIIAFQFEFNSEFLLIMLVIFNIILFTLPTPKQVLLYFLIIFSVMEIALLFSDISIGFYLLVSISFGYVFAMSYVISLNKMKLTQKTIQNGEILQTLLNNTNDSIFLVDYFSRQVWDANEKSKEMFGWLGTSEILTQKYDLLFAEDDFIAANRNEITQEISQFGHYQTEVLLKRKNGDKFWGLMLLSPFNAVKNNYYLIQIKNIDVKKKYDDQLLANNDKFKFILNNLEEFIYLISYTNGVEKFEYISPYIETIFGLTKDEYINNDLREKLNELYHPEDFPKLKALKEELISTNKKVSTTYRLKPIGKIEYIILHETVIPQLDENGNIEQLLGIIREVHS